MKEFDRSGPYFYAEPSVAPRDADYYKMKALVYLHLNIFEEMVLTTQSSRWVGAQFEREGWDEYILRKMGHPLMLEVFDKEAEQIYPGKFSEFVRKNRVRIKPYTDPGPF